MLRAHASDCTATSMTDPESIEIRPERAGDETAIRRLTDAAFAAVPYSDGTEGMIVDALRADGDLALSLVAVVDDETVGHVAFSPVTVGETSAGWLALGPVSVAPRLQRQGVGAALIREGLARIAADGAHGCVLVGDPAYYGRFGFASDGALRHGDVDPRFLQRLVFRPPAPRGELRFAPGFGAGAGG